MSRDVIDVHVHFGAPQDEASGCYWSKKFEQQPAYYAMLLMTESLFKKIDINRVHKQLLRTIKRSKYVDKVVVLAMDEVYDAHGVRQKDWTPLYVPNNYVLKLAHEYDRVLFGASVHPYREDCEQEIERCLGNGAVLCKWIPSTQMINPEDSKCDAFYDKLAKHHLPLLCHAGPEYSIPTHDKSFEKYNNPKYLRKALGKGVTIILAHCSLPYFGFLDVDYQDDFDEFLKLFKDAEQNNWKLYADVSAVCGLFRIVDPHDIDRVKDHVPANRLLLGSDYPVPLSELSFNKSKNFFSWLRFVAKVISIKNALDKNYKVIKKMHFGDQIFTNASELFAKIQY